MLILVWANPADITRDSPRFLDGFRNADFRINTPLVFINTAIFLLLSLRVGVIQNDKGLVYFNDCLIVVFINGRFWKLRLFLYKFLPALLFSFFNCLVISILSLFELFFRSLFLPSFLLSFAQVNPTSDIFLFYHYLK